jgi:hypothetical protein
VSGAIGNSAIGNFVEFQFKPYSHDLLNRDKGYIPFSESGKFNTSLRYYEDSKRFEVSKFSIIKLTSLAPYNSLTNSKSYGLDLGVESITVRKNKNEFDFDKLDFKRITPLNGDILIGYTFQSFLGSQNSPFILSLLAGGKAQIHPYFNDFIRIGPQAVFNVLWDLGRVKLHYLSTYQYYMVFRNQNDHSNSIRLRYSMEIDHEIRIELIRLRNDREIQISYSFMF